jgi:hypothetical protein
MKVRSPVLGYNHNVRYAGRLWHVQTEDSGVQNPHVFTHLFHDGTILATKRLDYDPASEVSAVQKLMQTQHKAMLRELKSGVFDEKIGKFFGEPVLKVAEDETTDPNARPALNELDTDDDRSPTPVDLPPVGPRTDPSLPAVAQPPEPAPPPPRAPTPARSAPAVAKPAPQPIIPSPVSPTPVRPAAAAVPQRPGVGTVPRPRVSTPVPRQRIPTPPPQSQPTASGVQQRPVNSVGGIGARRPSSVATNARPTAEGVVVARPAVIIGGEGTGQQPRQPAPSKSTSATRWHSPSAPTGQQQATPADPSKTPTQDNIFGGDLISEKSLDEVILAYLSEDLNEK